MTQQSSGVTSQRDGEIEVPALKLFLSIFFQVWLDRTLAQDDSRGMGQPVKDNSITRNTFKIILESTSPSSNPDSIYLVKRYSNKLISTFSVAIFKPTFYKLAFALYCFAADWLGYERFFF